MYIRTTRVADCSFLRFVYPFTFRPETFAARVKALDKNTSVWTVKHFPAGETLSHVSDYLKSPESEGVDKVKTKPEVKSADETESTARLWKLSDQSHSPLRLPHDLSCSLLVKNKPPIPFHFGGTQRGDTSVEMALFGIGVGFLTVTLRPDSPDVSAWLAFLHYFRVIDGNNDVSLSITPPAETAHPPEFACGPLTYLEVQNTLLATAAVPEDNVPSWWYNVFVPGRMIPFAVLFVDGLPDEMSQSELLYRVRNFFRMEQAVIAAPDDLTVRGNSSLLPYAQGQQFVFSLEGGSFVAFDAPPDNLFFRETLPSHLRDQYFLVFLLALHQRFALIRLSQRVAGRWKSEPKERYERFGRVREDFLDFSARGYFVQVMQREHHHRCYRKWQDVFQIETLYQEVRASVREMHEYLLLKQNEYLRELGEEREKREKEQAAMAAQDREAREQRAKNFEQLIISATLVVAIPTLTFTFLAINLEAYKLTVVAAAEIAVGAFLVSALTIWAILRLRSTHKN